MLESRLQKKVNQNPSSGITKKSLLHIGLLVPSFRSYLSSRHRRRLHLNVLTTLPLPHHHLPSLPRLQSIINIPRINPRPLIRLPLRRNNPAPTLAPLAFDDEYGLDDININGPISRFVPYRRPGPPDGRSRCQDTPSPPTPTPKRRTYLH